VHKVAGMSQQVDLGLLPNGVGKCHHMLGPERDQTHLNMVSKVRGILDAQMILLCKSLVKFGYEAMTSQTIVLSWPYRVS